MTKYSVNTCPLCEQVTSREVDGRKVETVCPVYGVVVELGYSMGGWGNRRTPISYSGLVCHDCFQELGKLLEPTVEFLRNNSGRESDKASVWSREPSPGRRPPALLRKMPKIFG